MEIKKVVVIGSGTMGSGIAAHLCNANVPVTLLDLTTDISTKARERIHKSRPPLLIDKSKIDNIKVGNINDDFNVVKEADWIVEAVVERIDIKHQIYKKIFDNRKDGAIVSSNTSSIPIKILSENMTDEQKKDFCITHFFNPVRYMGLLEIVKNENNDLKKINSLKVFCEKELGKGAIVCNDTPGFLGNRVGVYAMQVAMTEAFKMKLTIEEADAVFGIPIGLPKIASASSTESLVLKASVIATCIAYTPTLLPKKPGVSLQTIAPLPNSISQNSFNSLILLRSLFSFFTISNKPMYLTGLKKCVIQKSFFCSSVIFSDRILIGIEEVLDETIAPSFLLSKIFL